MEQNKSFYITTTLPYVNAEPHIGFATEIIRADVIARFKRYQDFEVFFNTGTDEHGQKIWQNSQEAGKNVQDYVDEYAEKFKELIALTNINPDIRFIRTTDEHHISAAQEFWKRCEAAGDIYKKLYVIKYCVGCELEKTDSELVEGKCPIHPNRELEIREEENYFFKFSKYEKPLLDFYSANPGFVVPDFRFNEIIAFVKRGLQDFSISRLKSKMSWGVPVPGDEEHVMYVWFDALINYISTLGWPENEEQFKQFWVDGTPVQYAGKDNLRQQSAMWQSMLMSAGLPLTKHVVINGFINSNGQKMSKSLGNVVNPKEIVEKYGAEALRYLVCREFSSFEDSDFTWEKMAEAYNANLSNGIGNLVARIMKLSEDHLTQTPKEMNEVPKGYNQALENFEIKNAIDLVFQKIAELDEKITKTEPFKVIKTDIEKGRELIIEMVKDLHTISYMLMPFMPRTGQQIYMAIDDNKKPENLFPRLNA